MRSITSIPSRLFVAVTGAFLATIILFAQSIDISNNFDQRRLFTLELIIPACCILLCVIVIQRFVDLRVLRSIALACTLGIMLVLGFTSANFEAFNGDDVMFIAGYVIVYHPVMYMTMIAAMPSLLYVAFLSQVHEAREKNVAVDQSVILKIKEAPAIAVVSIVMLVVASKLSFGLAHLAMAGVIGICYAFDNVDVHVERGDQDGSIVNERVQASSRAKNVLVALVIVLLALVAGFSWCVDFTWYGIFQGEDARVHFEALNPRLVIDEGIFTLAVFAIGSWLLTILFKGKIGHIVRQPDAEMWFALLPTIILAGTHVLQYLGTTILHVRVASLSVPWIALSLACWTWTFMVKRQRDSPGIAGSLVLFCTLVGWASPVIGLSPDIEYLEYIIPVIIISCAILIVLLIVIATPMLLEHRRVGQAPRYPEISSGNAAATGQTRRAGAGTADRITSRTRQFKRLVPAIITIACVALPVGFATFPALAPTNFQVLANVDGRCIFFLADPTTRVDKDYRASFGLAQFKAPNSTIHISAARNEYEPVQVVMQPTAQKYFAVNGVSFSGFENASGSLIVNNTNFQAFRVRPVEEIAGVVPDMLEEFSAFGISDGSCVPIWLEFYVPAGTPAGHYNGTVTISTQDPSVEWYPYKSVPLDIRLTVFNMTLPTIPTIKSAFGISDAAAIPRLMPVFQSHRMMRWYNKVTLPKCTLLADGSIDTMNFTATDAVIDGLHAAGTYLPGFHFFPTVEYLRQILPPSFTVNSIVYTNASYFTAPELNTTLSGYLQEFAHYYQEYKNYTNDFGKVVPWFDSMYFNGHDEIDGVGGQYKADALKEYAWLASLNCPFPLMQTVGGFEADTFTVLNSLPRAIICWHTTGYEQSHITAWKQSGKEVWIYTTRGPRFPAPSLSTSGLASQVRALGWQCFIYNYSTYLIWDVITPWNSRQGHAYQGWSGGTAFYEEFGTYRRSTRLELVREGFEDYEYFYLLTSAPDSPQKVNLLQRVSALMDGYQVDVDYLRFQRLRVDIGAFLS